MRYLCPLKTGGTYLKPRFLPSRNEDAPVRDPHALTSTILTQYLLALMGAPLGGPNRSQDPLRNMLPGIYGIGAAPQGAEAGRWGDYALNQEGKQWDTRQHLLHAN